MSRATLKTVAGAFALTLALALPAQAGGRWFSSSSRYSRNRSVM